VAGSVTVRVVELPHAIVLAEAEAVMVEGRKELIKVVLLPPFGWPGVAEAAGVRVQLAGSTRSVDRDVMAPVNATD
jgi:hypothetical protein